MYMMIADWFFFPAVGVAVVVFGHSLVQMILGIYNKELFHYGEREHTLLIDLIEDTDDVVIGFIITMLICVIGPLLAGLLWPLTAISPFVGMAWYLIRRFNRLERLLTEEVD